MDKSLNKQNVNTPREETMSDRIERLMYQYGDSDALKPKHLYNKNIINSENWRQPPRPFLMDDRESYPSNEDQRQRIIQEDPQMQNTMTINEIMLAESKPSDIKKQDKETRKLIRMAKAKRFRLLNEEKRSKVGTPKTEKLFENIFDANGLRANNKKPVKAKSPVKAPVATVRVPLNSGGAIDDPDYSKYIKEIELGNLDPSIPFDKWIKQYEETDIDGPLSRKEKTVLDDINLESALAKIEEAMMGVSGLMARARLEGGGKVIKFSDYKKPRIKELDLASYFKAGMAVANLTPDERDIVNDLLRRTLGKDPK